MLEPRQTAEVDLLDPRTLENPYPAYHYLHEHDPVHWSSIFGGAWLVSRHSDVELGLHDSLRLSSRREIVALVEFEELRALYGDFSRFYSNIMLVFDGKDHIRRRSLVQRVFTPRSVEKLRPLVRRIVLHLLRPFEAKRSFDIVADLAYPLPALVIAELMGLPWEDRDELKQWADDLALFIGGSTNPADMAAAAQRSMRDMAAYFLKHIEDRRRNPGDDLISRLLVVKEAGQELSTEETWAQCLLLLTAGHQTTRDLISAGVWAMIQNPRQWELLRHDRGLIESAVEECLRYDSPVQMVGRIATESFSLGGREISKGQRVIFLLGAANRDPAVFSKPDTFEVSRTQNRHVAFGAGPHHCIGAFLARLEGQVVLDILADRCRTMRLEADRPERTLNATFRRIQRLPISWE